MITINSITINSFSDKIDVSVTVSPGTNSIITLLFWTHETFKNYSKAIDLSHLVPLGSVTLGGKTYTFSIPNSEVNLPNFNGLYFLEFASSLSAPPENCIENSNKALGIAANYIAYSECLLDKVLALDIKGCNEVEPECNGCKDNVEFISTLINSLYLATKYGYYTEAIKIIKSIEDKCGICHSCPNYGNTLLINGYGFGTVNNSIIQI